MNASTELYFRNRANIYTTKLTEIAEKALQVKGERRKKAIEIIDLLLKASTYQDELLDMVLHTERRLRKKELELAETKEKLREAGKMIKELKAFMTHE